MRHLATWFTWIPLILCLILLLFCAGPIDPTNIFDPENNGGDYRFSTELKPGRNDTMTVFYPCTLFFHDIGSNHYREFYLDTLPVFAENMQARMEGNRSYQVMFISTSTACSLFIHAVRQNSTVDDDTVTLSIVNPYTIRVDSASYLRADTVQFCVANSRTGSSYDSLLTVKWFPEGEDVQTLDFNEPFMIRIKSDTLILSAELIDTSGNKIKLSAVNIPVPVRREPFVRVEASQMYVPLNTEFSINSSCRDADSLVWATRNITVVNNAHESTKFTHSWTEATVDTLIVTPKNRFGTVGNSDTVIIRPRYFRYGIRPVIFPEKVWARKVWEWEIAVIDSSCDSACTDTTVGVRWEVVPNLFLKGAILDESTGDRRLRFNYPDTISSFIIRVTAGNDTDSSWCIESNIQVVNHAPKITSMLVSPRTIPIGDTVNFIIDAIDTNSGGSVERVFYKTESILVDSQLYVSGMTVKFPFETAGEQEAYFWCTDNDGIVSDTVIRTVTVTDEKPYFLKDQKDTTIYIGNHITLWGNASTRRNNDSIVSWIWMDSDMKMLRTTETDSIDTLFTTPGMHQIKIKCISVQGDTSYKTAVRNVRVSLGLPVVENVEVIDPDDSVFVNDSFTLRIVASDSNGTVARLLVCRSTVSAASVTLSDDTITMSIDSLMPMIDREVPVNTPQYSGIYAYSVIVIDNKGQFSRAVTVMDSLVVHLGIPSVDKVSPDNCWMNDSVTYTISAHDGNGDIVSYWVRWGEDGSFIESERTVRQLLSACGNATLYCYVIDNDSLRSEIYKHTINVKRGRPLISDITTEKEIYINDTVTFTMNVADSNDTKVTISSSWDGDTDFEQDDNDIATGKVQLNHLFDKTMIGENILWFKVTDSDGNSDSVSFTCTVNNGAPSIEKMTVDTAEEYIFVNDLRTYTINAKDPNGYLRMIYVNWDGDSTVQDSISIEENRNFASPTIRHRFGTGESGDRKIALWTTDDDGIRSVTATKSITVEKGTPVLIGKDVDTFWVNDDNEMQFEATDPNGTILRYYADWDRNGVWDESAKSGDLLSHGWDTTYGGRKITFDVVAMDDDSIYSKPKAYSAFIRTGRPVILGVSLNSPNGFSQWKKAQTGGLDTLFIISSGNLAYDKSPVKCDFIDTNGTYATFIWKEIYDKKSFQMDTVHVTYNIPSDIIDVNIFLAETLLITAIDDDSLQTTFKFLALADEGPQEPVILNPPAGTFDSGITIRWKNQDFRDSLATSYQIMIGYDDENPERELVSFKKGSEFANDGEIFSYTFIPEKRSFRIQVVARDKWGSSAASNIAEYQY